MNKLNGYLISFIYALFIVLFLGTYEIDLTNEAKSGDIIQYLYNIEFVRNIDFFQAILYFFPSVLWGSFLYLIAQLFSSEILIVNFIKFIIAFFICLISYRKTKRKSFLLLILFSTLILEFYIGTLRQGLSTVFFLYGFFHSKLKLKTIFYIFSILIHPIILWVISIDILAKIISKINKTFRLGKIKISYRFLLLIVVPLLFIFFLEIFSQNSIILNLFGYSDGRYSLNQSSGRSIFGFLIWFLMLLIMFFKKTLYKDEIFSILTLAQVCLLYFSFESIYRLLGSAIIIIIINAINNKSIYNNLVLTIFLFFTIFHYSVFIQFGKL